MERLYELKEEILNRKYLLLIIAALIIISFIIGYNIHTKEVKVVEYVNVEDNEEKEMYMIDIKGQVLNPGTYQFKKDSRVIDAIKEAGGLLEDADTSVINLSKKIIDSMVINIYSKDEVSNFTKTKEKENIIYQECKNNINDACIEEKERIDIDISTTDNNDSNKLISINNATVEELMTLNGVGRSKAMAIINYREEHGLFTSIEDIKNVTGIGEKMFEKIKNNITL